MKINPEIGDIWECIVSKNTHHMLILEENPIVGDYTVLFLEWSEIGRREKLWLNTHCRKVT